MNLPQLALRVQSLGLSEKQAKVYVANLFLGSTTVQKIAEQAQVSRPSAYDILDELVELRLVTRSSLDNKTVFVAAEPVVLADILKAQADEVFRRRSRLEEMLPQLEEIDRRAARIMPEVRFVHGKEGVDAAWAYLHRTAESGEEVLRMANHDQVVRLHPEHFETDPEVRLKKKLSSKQLYYNSRREVPSDRSSLTETARLYEPFPADITLHNDKAVLLSYGEDKALWTGVVIENKNIVETLRQLFMLAWNSKK
jgi:sugar-specific transcriptional regulator TrmB